MACRLTGAEVNWLLENQMRDVSDTSPPPGLPGQFFRDVLSIGFRDSLRWEMAYMMLAPGQHLRFDITEEADVPPRCRDLVYHGTCLGAMWRILRPDGRLRPTHGAGSAWLGKLHGIDSLPIVYTSRLKHTAAGYVGNVQHGQSLGNGPMVTCLLVLRADLSRRLFHKKPHKNRQGCPQNDQQGNHPADLVICGAFLHCVKPASALASDMELTGRQRRRKESDLRAASALLFNEGQAPWWTPPPRKPQVPKTGSVKVLGLMLRAKRKRDSRRRRLAVKRTTAGRNQFPMRVEPAGVAGSSGDHQG
jgi:hypothetical protein